MTDTTRRGLFGLAAGGVAIAVGGPALGAGMFPPAGPATGTEFGISIHQMMYAYDPGGGGWFSLRNFESDLDRLSRRVMALDERDLVFEDDADVRMAT